MIHSRRRFVAGMATLAGATTLTPASAEAGETATGELPPAISTLTPLPGEVVKISAEERASRLEQARRLMASQGLDALVLEPGASLTYFVGARWWLSERPFLAVIPARGELAFVSPAFEEARAREKVGPKADVRVWQEDESPYARVAQILKDRGLATGHVAVEEQVRFFIYDGMKQACGSATFSSGTPVTNGCRRLKSPAELRLLQRSNDIALAVQRAAFASLREGMTQEELAGYVATAFTRLGAEDGDGLVAFGTATAFPHGSVQPQRLKDGDVVLIDIGGTVEGYHSDVTRTSVFGRPTPRQTEIWNLERRAQDAAYAAARPGAPCEAVDAAARKVITAAGFGPGYAVPGLPHRTGHGIGLEGHEAPNLVAGEKTTLQPGMCFSNEPTIAIYGEFGIRLEDCFYMTEDGPRPFTPQSPAIDRPFA